MTGLLSSMLSLAMAVGNPVGDTLKCESLIPQMDSHLLSETGFSRVRAKVTLSTVIDVQPVIAFQQKSATGERLNFAMVVRAPSPPGKPRLPLFTAYIEHADKDADRILSSEEAIFYAYAFDLTITRDATGKARMEIVSEGRNGLRTSVVNFDSAGFGSGPVTLVCMGGTYELSDLTIE